MQKSTDAGQTWKEINNGLHMGGYEAVGSVVIDRGKPLSIYASVNGRVYHSTNGGESWTEAGTGLPSEASISQLALNPMNSSILYAAGTKGLWLLQQR
jgi:photosystem II stability/assembly factor-like uncharacterized protein